MKSIGFETNPFAYFLSKVKSENYSLKDIKSIEKFQIPKFYNIPKVEKKYECGKNEPEPLPDGVSWTLQLRSPDGKVKYATGYEKYPDTFNNLVDIFDELLGIKYDPDNKFFNYDEEEEE